MAFTLDRDGRVFCGGSCDSGGIAAAVPELREAFALGHLHGDGLLPLIEAYRAAPPRALQLLDEITWGELADRYGEPANDEIFLLDDLPNGKWVEGYLRDELSRGPHPIAWCHPA
jgi:hypothetical protein